MKLALRDYQIEAHARTDDAVARGVRAMLGVAATGLGKTVIFTSYAEKIGGRTLILAHRDELIAQAVAKVREVWPDANVGIVKASENDVRADVVVASVQTLSRPKRLAQLIAAYEDGWTLAGQVDPFSLVVVDEAHHATADSYGVILDALRAGETGCRCGELHERAATPDEVDDGCELGVAYDPCPMLADGPLLLGVTATPDRADGKGLDARFHEIVWSYDLLWGIRSSYLADLRGLRIKLDRLDLDRVKVSRGDFEAGAAGRAMEDADAPALIARAWLADHEIDGQTITARGRPTLVFTPTVALAEQVAAEFVGAGIPAAYVSGETPLEDRRRVLADFAAGRVTVLANCAVLTEGYDEPSVSCIVQARPTKSRALYTQMVGRGTRRHPDKDYCLVLDVVGSSDDLSLVTIPSLVGIDQKIREYRAGESVVAAVEEHEKELVRLGRITAEEADLFAAVRREGVAWVAVHRAGDPLRRYERSLARDELGNELPTVVLAQRVEGEDVWTAGLWWRPSKTNPEGRKDVLMVNVPLELAQGVAEDFVRKVGSASLVNADARWRKGKPSPKAIAAAKKWRLPVEKGWTAGELSDALDAHIARIKARPKTRGAR